MNRKLLYPISFIEGGAVMVTEIAGAKLLSPYFGASIYSWAATLSITLLALMCGYFTGGYLTTRPKWRSMDRIVWVFLFSGIFVMVMPSVADAIMTRTISFSFFSGLIISLLSFLMVPVFLMAMISPMIIHQITAKAEESGKRAGSIYALSTSGGIVFTLVFGFYIIPEYGISFPVRILGIFVSISALALLISKKVAPTNITGGIVILLLSLYVLRHQSLPSFEKLTVLDSSEGLLGELKVVDVAGLTPDGQRMHIRTLNTNNVPQNQVLAENPSQSLLYYVNFTKQILGWLPERRSALLVGLGAGSLYRIMCENYKSVTSVELDKRIYDYGVRYFGMAEHANVVDDGRHYINTCDEKYDLIMVDVIVGENVPEQMISLECFKKCRDLLSDKGVMIIENGAVMDFEHNSFAPSIVKTLTAAGLNVSVFNPLRFEDHGDIIYIASKEPLTYSNMTLRDDMMLHGGPVADYALNMNVFDEANAKLLTDDRNYTDKLLKEHYLSVRKELRDLMAKEFDYINFSSKGS